MKRPWGRSPATLGAAALALSALAGCPAPPATSEQDAGDSLREGTTVTEQDATASGAGAPEDGDAGAWPEGWVVARHEEWIPVLDELGLRLHAARRAFTAGDRTATSEEIQEGLRFLETQRRGASVRDLAAIDSATATLRSLAARLAAREDVTLEQLDIAIANAYRSDLERAALVVETGTAEPYLSRPEAHLQRAVDLFLAGESGQAAREVDRAAAYLRLEGNRLEVAERAQLTEAAQGLERVAAQLRLEEIGSRAELDRAFDPALQAWRRLARPPALRPSLHLMR